MKTNSWNKLFPYATPRDQQIIAIDKILESFKNKRFFALEAGTGVGKSAVGLTVAKKLFEQSSIEGYEPGAIFVTTQKLLQDQYESDFHKAGMKSIKSSTNYKCNYKKHMTCAQGQAEIKTQEKGTKFWNACTFNCAYKKAKQDFIDSKLSVTNFPYLLTESNYNGKIKPRQLLIIDEAHNVETELSKFIEVSISEKFCKSALKLSLPNLKTHYQAFTWIKEIYWPKIDSYAKHIKSMLEKYQGVKKNLDQFASLSKQLQLAESHHKKIQKFIEVHDKDNWVFETQFSNIRGARKITFKPIDVSKFAQEYLFRLGYKVLFMSATLLSSDKFFESLGIKEEDASSLSLSSPFPVKNRPILHVPMGKMTAKEIDQTLPVLAAAIEKILEQHKNEKGIIHTHSYKISKAISTRVKSDRLIFPDASNRDAMLKKHIKSKKPTVLVSPSMTEGVDLQGDASRFQVLCKVPYPYLGDKLVKKRMNKWKWWYPFQTAKTIIQAIGRSVRSQDDIAVTYILDTDWERFYRFNKELFTQDFKDCLK
jgi:ATP-dependent DNA helicase DinG